MFIFFIVIRLTQSFIPSSKHIYTEVFLAKRSMQNSRELLKKVDQYIKIRDLKKQGNLTQVELMEYSQKLNTEEERGYKKFVGKGTLDQRLRAIIAYKRDNAFVEGSLQDMDLLEKRELDSVMEDDGDYEPEEDDIDLIYEREIQRILEMNALEEVKRNMVQDTESPSSDTTSTPPHTENGTQSTSTETAVPKKAELDEADYYTPATASWGIFPRPRNISKAFGGGRVISREEMTKRQEEYDREMLKVRYSRSLRLHRHELVTETTAATRRYRSCGETSS